jgi:hypothetical protein
MQAQSRSGGLVTSSLDACFCAAAHVGTKISKIWRRGLDHVCSADAHIRAAS